MYLLLAWKLNLGLIKDVLREYRYSMPESPYRSNDALALVAKLQNQISTYMGLDDKHLVFDFVKDGEGTKLNLVTVNPRHNQSFLFGSTHGIDKADALEKMLSYISTRQDKEYAYTVQWIARGDDELHTSYFSARNMYGALDKLNYGRDENNIQVYVIQLNPIT